MKESIQVMRQIPPEWSKLMDFVEQLKFGEVRLVIQQGKPVRVEAAIQQGYVAYAKAFDQAPAQARIGERPLVLRALRVAGDTRVDLVLSQAEATRIRDYTATRRLLRQCRVLIVM